MTKREKATYKDMCAMETDFLGYKRDKKKKDANKLAPRIRELRLKDKIRRHYG